jgi:hypothetical protein
MASMNPGGADYHVDQLDPALLSRFVQAEITADVDQWAYWARSEGDVHPKVIEFAEHSPGIFDPGEANPRALAYLSKQLRAWEKNGRDPEILIVAASGLVGETWAIAFYQYLTGGEAPLSAAEIIDDYLRHKAKFTGWVADGKLDLVRASLHPVKRVLDEQFHPQKLGGDEQKVRNLRGFVEDLPADLGKAMRDWLAEKNFEALI